MALIHQRIARAIPTEGFDVHVYDYGTCGSVVLIEDGAIRWQAHPDSFGEAKRTGLHLAALYDCEMVEHHPYANRSIEA